MTQEFALGEVLSITTGKLLCQIDGVYRILNFLTNDNLFTHQLPRASRECAPFILAQHPKLAAIDATTVNTENWKTWLSVMEGELGSTLSLSPIPPESHRNIDPISEIVEMRDARCINVAIPSTENGATK